jgi:DNA polymerase-4
VFAERSIIHLNVADFAVAVERILDSRLRGRPVLIAPEGLARAAVYDMSEEAYRAGVRKGMELGRARRLCRDGLVAPPRPDCYERAAQALLKQACFYTPLVELVDENGHLFLDVTGTARLWGPPADVAWRLRKAAKAEHGLNPIWSVAPNKLVAKTATRLVKPEGEYIVEAGEEEAFMRAVPLALLPGLEREELLRLREFHLRQAGDVARLTAAQLALILESSAQARTVHDAVRGVDTAPVLAAHERAPRVQADHDFSSAGTAGVSPAAPSEEVGEARGTTSVSLVLVARHGRDARGTYGRQDAGDTNAADVLLGALYRLVEQAGAELRARQRAAQRVSVWVDYCDGVRLVRSAAPDAPTANDFRLFKAAKSAFERAWSRRIRIRHLRLICERLTSPYAQLELFPEDEERTRRENRLVTALDAIRRKFGAQAIAFGRSGNFGF